MRTLGLSGGGSALYMAVAVDGAIVDVKPHQFEEPLGLPQGRRFSALRTEASKVVAALRVERVRILNAEATYKASYTSLITRIALETMFTLGSGEAGVDCDRMTRSRLRSLLGLPRAGALASHVASLTVAVGPHWAGKRDLAALTALAAGQE